MPNDYDCIFTLWFDKWNACCCISVFSLPPGKKGIKIQFPKKDLHLLGREKKQIKKHKTHKTKQIFPSKLW